MAMPNQLFKKLEIIFLCTTQATPTRYILVVAYTLPVM